MAHEMIRLGQLEIQFLLESSETGGTMAMFEFMVPPGAKVPMPHYHEAYDETVYGVEGVMTFNVDGKKVELRPGECCFIRRGMVHGFNNLSQARAKALGIVTHGLIGRSFFQEVAAVVNRGGPPDVEVLKAILLKYGLVAAMPAGH